MRPLLSILLCILGLPACGPSEARGPARGHAQVGGQIVATVHGHPITRAEVVAHGEAHGLSARHALTELEDRALLASAAERDGFGIRIDVRLPTDRALVRSAVTQLVEVGTSPEDVELTALRAAYDAQEARFGAKRDVRHVLARSRRGSDSRAVARAFCERVRNQLADGDAEAVYRHLREQDYPRSPFSVSVEELPTITPQAGYLAEFKEAIFAASEPGVLPTCVDTEVGYHAVLITGTGPEISLAQAESALRRELSLTIRLDRLRELTDGLVEESNAQYNEEAIIRAVAVDFSADAEGT